MRNLDIREEISKSGIRYWMVAERLGISDVTLSRRLRKELPGTEKQKIRKALFELRGAC